MLRWWWWLVVVGGGGGVVVGGGFLLCFCSASALLPLCYPLCFRSASAARSALLTAALRRRGGGLIFFDQSVKCWLWVGFGRVGWGRRLVVVVVQHNAFSRGLCDDLCNDCVVPWSLLSFVVNAKGEPNFRRVTFSPTAGSRAPGWVGGGSIYIYIY